MTASLVLSEGLRQGWITAAVATLFSFSVMLLDLGLLRILSFMAVMLTFYFQHLETKLLVEELKNGCWAMVAMMGFYVQWLITDFFVAHAPVCVFFDFLGAVLVVAQTWLAKTKKKPLSRLKQPRKPHKAPQFHPPTTRYTEVKQFF
jgi:hypothetical protein